MTMSLSRSSDQGFREQIEEEYNKLRNYFISNNVSHQRSKWHPLVILATAYKGRNVFHLIDDCKKYLDSTVNLAIEALTVREYEQDTRYMQRLLPPISRNLKNDATLLLYFDQSYIPCSLNVQLENLEELKQYDPSEIKDRLDLICSSLNKTWPYTYMKLIPHGSYLTGLAFRKSPINICIELDEPDLDLFVDKSMAKIYTHRYPANIDAVLRSYKSKQAVKDHATNLIRFHLRETPFEIDFNKEITTESTYLILEYMKLDPRVRPFLNAIKHWGRDRSLFTRQYAKGLRFYSYTIMALAYLQQLDPPVIPNLQHLNGSSEEDECVSDHCKSKSRYWDVAYNNGERVGIAARYHDCVEYKPGSKPTTYRVNIKTNQLYWNSSNNSGVGELFFDFLHYYGYRFDYRKDAVSLKYGGTTPKKSDWYNHPVAIEDPFISRNLGEPASDFPKFVGDIRGSFTILQSGLTFTMMCKRIGEIMRYDSVRGRDNDRAAYVPLPSRIISATSKTFLLIDLPRETESSTYADRIRNLFSTHGEITRLLNVDATTKQVFFKADNENAKDIVLPTSFTLDGKTVYLVELYDYTDPQRKTPQLEHQPQHLLI